jgi:hypothetical protein
MLEISFHDLIPVLQIAIGPVILISGVGLLLLSMTNRLGRVVDRSRELMGAVRDAPAGDQPHLAGQVDVLYRRAHLLQYSIVFAATSVLLAALLVIMLFVFALMKWQSAFILSLLFVCCLLSLIVSLVIFIVDIRVSLTALSLELGRSARVH